MKTFYVTALVALTLQACAAAPIEKNEKAANLPNKELADRFSIKAIKEKREAEFASKLRELNAKSPSQEVQSALRVNNFYLYSYFSGRGGQAIVPGLIEPQPILTKCKLVQMDGMGDAIYGPNHMRYREANRKYSAEFNRGMVSFCR